jgi:phospholipase/carboxylesterase
MVPGRQVTVHAIWVNLAAMRLERFGDLDVRITGGTDGRGGGNGPVVVLLHGYGAPGTDLVPLGQAMAAPAGTRFVFPAAPLAMPAFFGESRAWWMLDLAQIERVVAAGQQRSLAREVPPGLGDARARLLTMLHVMRTRMDATSAPLVLGGFSQGAMLACDVALRTDVPLAGLVMLSGTLLCVNEWQPLMARRAGLRVFQSHGQSDPLLPFEAAEALRDHLRAAGLEVEWHGFAGVHEIPMPVLHALGKFLHAVLV